jgi:prolyl oligopeptidase
VADLITPTRCGAPPTEVGALLETLHGIEVADPYRWLEGSAAPEEGGADGDLDRRVKAWTAAQNAHTRAVLDAIPGRRALAERLRELMEIDAVSAPAARGERIFFWRRERGQPQWVACFCRGYDGEARVLVDPNRLDPEGRTSLAWTVPNHDGTLLAFGLFSAGDEKTVLHLLDVDRGTRLGEEIAGAVSDVYWLPDSSGFFYRRLADPANPYSAQIRFHRLGTPAGEDPVLFAQRREGPLATTWGPFAAASRDGRWLLLGYWTGTDANDLWAVDLDRWRRGGEFVPVAVVTGRAARSFGPVAGDTLFLHTNLDAPNGRVVAVDLTDPAPAKWREVVAERSDAVLEAVALARGQLVLTYLADAAGRIERCALDGSPLGGVELPGVGSVEVVAESDGAEALLSFSSFDQPPAIYRLDLDSGRLSLWMRPEVPVDASQIVVHRVRFRSRDGTEVPMFVVHRRDLRRDGDRPTVLAGYGGFGISQTPAFSAAMFPWLEAGGVYAVANLRGGGELGRAWHRAGMRDGKQRVFDDFIAAAEWLIAAGYTRPERLAIVGGSNGGLLIGAALTQRPELFAAAVCRVPLLDMLRYHNFLMGRYWVPEYGSADDPDQFAVLRAYSPYHNVRDGVAYPAVLLTAGENDARVHPLHARKMAARLQAATVSDPRERPVLLSVESHSGHGIGKPLADQIRESADQWGFLTWQLGVTPSARPPRPPSPPPCAPTAPTASRPSSPPSNRRRGSPPTRGRR